MLKIYKIEGLGNYSGGIVVVAANSEDEAADLANKNAVYPWNVTYNAKDAIEISNVCYAGDGNEATLIINYAMGE